MSMNKEDILDILCEKVEGNCNLTWEEIVDYCGLNISPVTLRKAFGASDYGGYAMLQKAKAEYANTNSDEQIDKLNAKIEELQEERRKLQVINREHNEIIRANADKSLFNDLILDAINNLAPIEVKPTNYNPSNMFDDKACLFIGDAHYGKEFELVGLFGEVINKYSPEIYQARMWKLLSEIDNDSYNIGYNELHVFDCGDAIDGILRTGTSLRKLKVGVVDSVLQYAEFMAHWLAELQSRLQCKIVYHLTGGNHDMLRLLGQKKDFDDENVGKFIHELIKLRLANIDDITIAPYDQAIFENVNGVNILCYHGDGKDMEKDINFFENYYNITVDMLVGAHLHHKFEESIGISDVGNKDIIRIPSICGTDDFAKKCRKHSRAGAKFMIINKDAGKTWEKTIWLN